MTDNKLAFVFPGQGSQSVGMSTALAEHYPIVKKLYAEASGVLGYDLWQLVHSGPESELNITSKTQPALLTAGVAVWKIWAERHGPLPALMAGHSLGEYSALVCSGMLAFDAAIALVADRGAYMQAAVPEGVGSMAAILGLTGEQIIKICIQAAQGQVVSAANFNSAGQIVIAGHKEAVNRAVEMAAGAGAKRSVVLAVSVPAHCALMQEAASKFASRMESISLNAGRIPVIHNVDVSIKSEISAIKQALAGQLYQPVRWVETIELMSRKGVTKIVECGPGKVLCGLIKRIDRQIETYPVFDRESLDKALSAMNG
ncbi:MAG: [acyl-carrier-protein] S-malonyltransferase [Gammaproteobacteria bacterium RIFCSPLOWO2_01_FULL_47_190]|nr:MAG: [acyl-carrier-protein] S-malonyltransferase [Gammaproteobacteria bacterium RIFCSPLOWO2_01_FULL_47_190]